VTISRRTTAWSELMSLTKLATMLILSLTASTAIGGDIPEVGGVAPDFTLNSITGESVQLSKLGASEPVVLVVLRGYPGYQCPACSAQVAQLIAKADELKAAKARVILIYPGPADGLTAKAGEFLNGKSLPEHFTLLLDPDYSFTKSYGLRWEAQNETAYPSTFVLGANDRKVRFAKVSRSHGGRVSATDVLKTLAAPQ
jgi:peroxiredoxin